MPKNNNVELAKIKNTKKPVEKKCRPYPVGKKEQTMNPKNCT